MRRFDQRLVHPGVAEGPGVVAAAVRENERAPSDAEPRPNVGAKFRPRNEPALRRPAADSSAAQLRARVHDPAGLESEGEAGASPEGEFEELTRGPALSLPFRDTLARAFGQSLSDIESYFAPPDAMPEPGVRAATDGERIAFASRSPSLETVAHETAHVLQRRRLGSSAIASEGGVRAKDSPAEVEARAVAARVAAGHSSGLLSSPLSAAMHFDDPQFDLKPNPWGLLKRDPKALVQELEAAVAAESGSQILGVLQQCDDETLKEVKKLYGVSFFQDVWQHLDSEQQAKARPYLSPAISVAQTLRAREGTVWKDPEGIRRTIRTMSDAQVKELVDDFILLGDVETGKTADIIGELDALLGKRSKVFDSESDHYDSLRLLSQRIAAADPTGKGPASELARHVKVAAAMQRIEQADREGQADMAFLAAADLDVKDRELLNSRLAGWRPKHMKSADKQTLDKLLSYSDDDMVIASAIEEAAFASDRDMRDASAYGTRVAADAAQRLLASYDRQLADPKLDERKRTKLEEQRRLARERLTQTSTLDALKALPGGSSLISKLGVGTVAVAKDELLKAEDEYEVISALAKISVFDELKVLEDPAVKRHLKDEGITLESSSKQVIDDYRSLTSPTVFPLVMLGQPARNPAANVAAYEMYKAADKGDVAGVIGRYQQLTPRQRAELGGNTWFQSATAKLEKAGTHDAKEIAQALDDAQGRGKPVDRSLLLGMGIDTERGYLKDKGLAAEAMAVDPGLRKLYRYAYVLDNLKREPLTLGVPSSLDLPEEVQLGFSARQAELEKLDPHERLELEDIYLGQPDLSRADMTPEEAALEASFMRIRVKEQIAAARRGIDLSGAVGWTKEQLLELESAFSRDWDRLSVGGWTRSKAAELAVSYYRVLDAVDAHRGGRDAVATLASTVAAVAAATVVVAATGGAAAPAVVTALAATAGGATSVATADALRDYTPPEQGLEDFGRGAVEGALTVVGGSLSARAVKAVVGAGGRAAIKGAARSAVSTAVGRVAMGSLESAIDGAIGGAGGELFSTALDEATWDRGVGGVIAAFLAAAARGAFTGALAGGLTGPVAHGVGAGVKRIGRIGRRLAARAGLVPEKLADDVAGALDHIAYLAEAGEFDSAMRKLDQIALEPAQRKAFSRALHERAIGSAFKDAEISDDAWALIQKATGAADNMDTKLVEELLTQLETKVGPSELSSLRKIFYGRYRLAPEKLIPAQVNFEREMEHWVDITWPRGQPLPNYEVRVLPKEAFEGMFQSKSGQAVTLLERERLVIYVRVDADPVTAMSDEVAHLHQLADPMAAPHFRMLEEQNLKSWAGMSAGDRFDFYRIKLEAEIDAQRRMLEILEEQASWSDDAADQARRVREALSNLEAREREVLSVSSEQLAEMNSGSRPLPQWLEEEPRLFVKLKGATPPLPEVTPELSKSAVRVSNSRGLKGQQAFQLGESWTETARINAGAKGTIKAVGTGPDGQHFVEVRTEMGGVRRYTVENYGEVADWVQPGARVEHGQTLAIEKRQYRRVELRDASGKPRGTRQEIKLIDEDGWVERGSARSKRGGEVEVAARSQVEAQGAARLKADAAAAAAGKLNGPQLKHFITIDPSHGRGGFDGVYVEIVESGGKTTAKIRIIEVKHYPGKYVPRAEFTAIDPNVNLDQNLEALRPRLLASVEALGAAGDIDAAEALEAAISAKAFQVEIHLGVGTKMGAESKGSQTVMAQLRKALEARPGTQIKLADKPVEVALPDEGLLDMLQPPAASPD